MIGTSNREWWSSRTALFIFMVAAALPLLWPSLPPLSDLPGHMGRYKVALDIDRSPFLSHYFDYHWALVGNLGVDLLVVPLSRVFGLELAVKLITIAIPPLTVAGMLFTAREIHGRVPPTALFALPLAYAYPFQFGFLNFTLAIALMFLGVGLWLRLGRLGKLRLRAILFVPISFILFIAHSVAWGMFGLIIAAIEIMTARKAGQRWPQAVWRGGVACLPLAPPVLLMADWWFNRSEGGTGQFWRWTVKLYHLISVLRNTSRGFDTLSAFILYALVLLGLRRAGLRMDPRLGFAALILFIAFLLMPGIVMSAAYADMRLAAYMLAVAVLALAPQSEDPKWRRRIALAGLLFFAVRLGVQTWTYWKLDRGYQPQLAAVEHIPMGSRVFAMVNVECLDAWGMSRMEHLGQMAIVRREAFVNGQWPMPGGRLLTVTYEAAKGFALDPTQMRRPKRCLQSDSITLEHVVAKLPRAAFDYLWLIDFPVADQPRDPGLVPVWQGKRGILYRIER
ncbi:hypothetical protein ACFB49_13350 [Sphingomonas sp. DBB INV C78]|uniref:hypothetical protein n=1 Tax=Sphingomonas sp. DBB INV C78 TaxID=3349434 RepID=UPI0036D3981D